MSPLASTEWPTKTSHAVRVALRSVALDDEITLLIGPARDGAMLEVLVLGTDDDDDDHEPVAIHAMPLRPKFHRYL